MKREPNVRWPDRVLPSAGSNQRGGGRLGLSKRAFSCHSPACKRYDPYDFRSASFWVIRKKLLCSSRKHISSKFRWRSSEKLLKNKSGGKQQPNRIKELCRER